MDLDNVEVVVGRCEDSLGGVVDAIKPVDHAFLDSRHDEEATLKYFDEIRSGLSKHAALVFDDINWSKDMASAWKRIIGDETVKISVNLGVMGICIIDSGLQQESHFYLPQSLYTF